MITYESDVTPAVLAVMRRTTDPRLRSILEAFVRHLHDFVREVRLTEEEFRDATAILNELGQRSTESHNETVLMAGSLGVSSLVCLLNNGDNGQSETSQSLLGPFWRLNAPCVDNGGSIVRSPTPGPVLFMSARVTDKQARPIAGAEVDIWHSSPVGLYENQDPAQENFNLRGKFTTDSDGRFWFRSVKPAGYPVPTAGVVGRLLAAQNRHPYRPAHVHALIFRHGFKTLISQVYADDDENLDSDVQFGVTRALVGHFEKHDEPHPTEADAGLPWYSLDYTYVMEKGEAKLPRPPIK
jgi:catechol 1,2-dioxygenase